MERAVGANFDATIAAYAPFIIEFDFFGKILDGFGWT
jgi:hypothetical protein